MKAIMISIKPKYCSLEMNGIKSIEVRKNQALASAIQKLIDEYGYADIYVHCSKGKKLLVCGDSPFREQKEFSVENDNTALDGSFLPILNGKVVFKFRCYKVDEYVNGRKWSWKSGCPMWGACNDYEYILKDCCLTDDELRNYVDDLSFSAIHISHLEIFNRPKEISDFRRWVSNKECKKCSYKKYYGHNPCLEIETITKAPQNFCYIEVEGENGSK